MKRTRYKYRGKRQRLDPVGIQVSCYGKVRWDKEAAHLHADEINSRLIGDRKVRPYKCRNCSTKDKKVYHVGREPKKEV